MSGTKLPIMASEEQAVSLHDVIRTAIPTGDIERLVECLQGEPDFLEFDHMGRTPLTATVQNGFVAAVLLLLQHGADPNAPDERNMLPVQMAVLENEFLILKHLIGHGANIHGISILPFVKCLDVLEFLLSEGCDPNFRGECGQTAIHEMMWMPCFRQILPLLLQYDARIDETNERGLTPLMEAAEDEGPDDNCILLLEHGARADILPPDPPEVNQSRLLDLHRKLKRRARNDLLGTVEAALNEQESRMNP